MEALLHGQNCRSLLGGQMMSDADTILRVILKIIVLTIAAVCVRKGAER